MDIGSIKPSENILDILHPATGESVGLKITLLSLDDEKMKKIKRQIQDRELQLRRKGKGFNSEQIEENGHMLLFSAMTGWSWEGDCTFHGDKPAFNQANVYKVFDELLWVRDQVDEKVGDTKSFFAISK